MKKVLINDVIVKCKRNIDVGNMKQFKSSYIHKMPQDDEDVIVAFERVNFDKDAKKKLKDGSAFLITNPEFQKNNIRTIDGIASPKFGPDMLRPDIHSYMCECGYLSGALNEDKICPKCSHKVQFITTDLTKGAFVKIAPFKILTYHGYNELSRVIKNLDEVLMNTKKINIKGFIEDESLDILDLYDFYEKHEKEIGMPIEYAFTSHIPVLNGNLRPMIKTDSRVTMFPINKEYSVMVSLLQNLKFASYVKNRKETASIMTEIQQAYLNVCNEMEAMAKGKDGDIRSQFTTFKLDYVSRMVIAPGIDLEPHEVTIPYNTIIKFYEEELIQILTTLGHSATTALDIIIKGTNKITSHMKRALKILLKKERWIIINRNPTIKYGSILYMKVKGYNKNIKDKTMKIPAAITPLMGADFDGDQLTAVCSKLAIDDERSYHLIYKYVFCPTYLFIDRGTGKVNGAMSFKKDHAVILTDLYALSKNLGYFMKSPKDGELENILGTPSSYNTYESIISEFVAGSPDDDDPVTEDEEMREALNHIYIENWEDE